jgi:alkanesulfonate monooxygenase SsuD/methylene tetrahydromethanopterin reductase-like flavin-dependent oxidoreductase (luciferase family)
MTTVGAIFLPQFAPELLRPVAVAADQTGLDELWLWEDCFDAGGLSTASAALAWTDRLRVGIGLVPVALRNVALTAMEVAAIDRMFPGRFTLGIGHGVQDWMAQAGARVDSPLTLLREYAEALTALLRGETVTTSGRYVRLDQVTLAWPPTSPPPLAAGAVGPRSLALCGEFADVIILPSETPPAGIGPSLEIVERGRRASGRTGPLSTVVYVVAATGPGAATRMADHRRQWGTGPDVGVVGDAAAIAEALAPWVGAGADAIVLQPTADEPDPVGFVEMVGAEVAPLLR